MYPAVIPDHILASLWLQYGASLCPERISLLLPYMKEMLSEAGSDNAVQAVWYLFGQLSQILGRKSSIIHLSPIVINLYSKGRKIWNLLGLGCCVCLCLLQTLQLTQRLCCANRPNSR